jgi:hypothetical protein
MNDISWEERKRRGQPSHEDVRAGRCLGREELKNLRSDEIIDVTWNGYKGPYICYVQRHFNDSGLYGVSAWELNNPQNFIGWLWFDQVDREATHQLTRWVERRFQFREPSQA